MKQLSFDIIVSCIRKISILSRNGYKKSQFIKKEVEKYWGVFWHTNCKQKAIIELNSLAVYVDPSFRRKLGPE